MSSGQAAFRERTVGAKFVCWQVAKKVPKLREEIVPSAEAGESRPLPEAPVNGQECSLAPREARPGIETRD
ncbi:hypothetical protein KTAU_09430 [Thermogemmatispora aurantia]|uniref:Uncharacterized protein n=1 Tax=Thermogemmatispora aurantia TaxID=2045279 RepID=A0A5J4K413_9CHLR|nr:hypothetical protein KTAU_09430 [Thermogemmatispora aurantia]